MCKIGDIIIVDKYKDHGKSIRSHSFVVVSDENGEIHGLSYDFPLTSEDVDTDPNNGKSGYIKADQWYYFSKDKISYMVIGNMKSDIFNLLIDYIEESDFEIVDIVDNL